MKRHQIFIVDDHMLVREGLATLIDQEEDLQVCGHADNARDAWDQMARLQPDAAIVDLSLRGESGIELIKRLPTLPRPPLVLVLSMHDDALYAERALRAGARGYVMKRESSRRVITGLREILRGRIYLNESVTQRVAERFAQGVATVSPLDTLSDRELEVFRRIGMGEENRQIADAIGLSLKTVQTHCAHIKEKLGLASGTLLMREAVRWVEQERAGGEIGPGPTGQSDVIG